MYRSKEAQRIKSTGVGSREDPFVFGVDVSVQDQSTDTLILPMVQVLANTVLSAQAVQDTHTLVVASATSAIVGRHVRVFNLTTDKYYFGNIVAVNGLTLTMDNAIDFAYPVGSQVTIGNTNMNVNGSVTPVHFHLRTGQPSIPSKIDVTRMILVATCSSAVDLNKFGNLTRLTRGILFRQYKDGVVRNIFGAHSNGELAALAYDFSVYSASNPSQGINGFAWRLTFSGQEKLGVTLRVEQTGQLGILVQDDLTGLTSLTCMIEGHVVQD